jgi:GT2 family glycosyltransferase
MDASVVICAYTRDRWDSLAEAIGSVRAQTVPPMEVLLVVDHNPLLLAKAKREWPDIRVLANEGASGLSGARNTGARAARGEVVAFLDDDAIADPDWIERLLAGYRSERVVAVGGRVDPLWERARPAWFPPEFDWVVGCSYTGLPRTTAAVRNPIGANMSFRRSELLAAGLFDERLCRMRTDPLGCEETELCIRLRRKTPTARLIYEPAARVRHHVPASRATWAYFIARCRGEGQSKAFVTHVAGVADGLRAERAYTLRNLSSAVVRGVARALRGDPAGLARAFAVTAGLLAATTSYLRRSAELRAAPVTRWEEMARATTNGHGALAPVEVLAIASAERE